MPEGQYRRRLQNSGRPMNPSGFSRLLLGLAVLVGCASACRHSPTQMALHGQSSHQFIEPRREPSAQKPSLKAEPLSRVPRDVFIPPQPNGPLINPAYPTAALEARLWPVTIGVRITIDPKGQISAIAPSPAVFSLPSKFANEFQTAVEAALAQWQFSPAEVRHMVPMVGAGDYWLVDGIQKVESVLDVAFTFTSVGDVDMFSPGDRGK